GSAEGRGVLPGTSRQERRATGQRILDAFRLCRKYGIGTVSLTMMGFPQEDFSMVLDTVKLTLYGEEPIGKRRRARAGGSMRAPRRQGKEARAEKLSGIALADNFVVYHASCRGCAVRCKPVVEFKDGPYAMARPGPGPEYESQAAFGTLIMNDNLAALTHSSDSPKMWRRSEWPRIT
ncbi:MAG: hypothetical protein H5T97_01970, partial [Firmicutes bacterium]|nr:hypothetical protein [Bacillota bacterium]